MSLLALPSAIRWTLPRWLPLAVVMVAAVIERQFVAANADVSWCLTLAENWLDGQRLYVDIIEVNPPATVLLYVVPVMLARLSGLSAEFVADALIFTAAGISLCLSGRVLVASKVIDRRDAWLFAPLVAFALVVLPAQTFGEREHIALITFMPVLAVAAARAEGRAPGLIMAIIAGIGGGATALVKPHFAAAIVCTVATAAVCARSWRIVLAIENWIAAATFVGYAVVVMLVFPRYISEMLPLVAAVYLPVKEDIVSFLLHAVTPLWLAMLALIAWIKRRTMLTPPFCLLLAASIGFSISYYVQRKGWPYHSYPMLALALLALALAVVARLRGQDGAGRQDRFEKLTSAAAVAVLVWATFHWLNLGVDRTALAAPIRAISPHPKILQISGDLSVGHPITRQVEGIWVSQVSSLWITLGAGVRRVNEQIDSATDARLSIYTALDRAMLTQDIASKRPDVILVQRTEAVDWLVWAHSHPGLAEQLRVYREDQTVGDVLILRRVADR